MPVPIQVKELVATCIFFQGSGPENIWEGHHLSHIRVEKTDWFKRWGTLLPSTDGRNNMTFDKSPSYLDTLIFPDVAAYAHRYVPNAKVVVTLCNPTERVYPEWNHDNDGITLENIETNFIPTSIFPLQPIFQSLSIS